SERQTNEDAEIRMFSSSGPSISGNALTLPARYADAILKGVHPTAEDPDLEPKPPVPGVVAASPVGEYIQQGVAGIGVEIIDGIDYESFLQTTPLRIVEGRVLGNGRAPDSEYDAIVDRYYAESNRGIDGTPVKIGSQIKVFDHNFTVVGIYEPSVLARVKIHLYTMQQLLGGVENCTFILIKVEKPEMAAQARKTLDEFYPGNS